MSSSSPVTGDVLPPRARLLHIGVPKTGTTALQQAAANNRESLLRHGVRYPGNAVSHRFEVAALMGRDTLWTARGPMFPERNAWRKLRAEIDADPQRRALVSHEYASASTDQQAALFREELGPDLHVVVTVRNYAELLGSRWQQYIKSGLVLSFTDWLAGVLAEPPHPDVTAGFHDNSDQGAIVERWCRVVGAERLTVVVSDKSRPHALANAFGGLLGVPADLMQLSQHSRATNRSLSRSEAELIRELNAAVRRDPLLWSRHQDLIRSGVIRRLQSTRTLRTDEQSLRLPAWAAPSAQREGQRHADQIAATGCRVIGELSLLHGPVPTVGDDAAPEHVPLDAALEALVGMMQAGVRASPRGAAGRPGGEGPRATRLGTVLGRVLPTDRMPPALRRKVHLVRRARRGWTK